MGLAGGALCEVAEIGRSNPLLFEFVLKRAVRHPQTGQRLAASVFMLPADWPGGGLPPEATAF